MIGKSTFKIMVIAERGTGTKLDKIIPRPEILLTEETGKSILNRFPFRETEEKCSTVTERGIFNLEEVCGSLKTYEGYNFYEIAEHAEMRYDKI